MIATRRPAIVLVHAAGDSGWTWHLVEAALQRRGFTTVAPDLPDGETSLTDHADVVVAAAADAGDVVIVGHSFGAFAATLAADRLPTSLLVYVSGMVPLPGEAPSGWWSAVGWSDAVREQAERDGGLTGHEDPYVTFYHDVPRDLADEAMRRERGGTLTDEGEPLSLAARPEVATRFVLCAEDRFFPADLMRRVAGERLGIEPDDLASGHCANLAKPVALADRLARYIDEAVR